MYMYMYYIWHVELNLISIFTIHQLTRTSSCTLTLTEVATTSTIVNRDVTYFILKSLQQMLRGEILWERNKINVFSSAVTPTQVLYMYMQDKCFELFTWNKPFSNWIVAFAVILIFILLLSRYMYMYKGVIKVIHSLPCYNYYTVGKGSSGFIIITWELILVFYAIYTRNKWQATRPRGFAIVLVHACI